jgi:phenylacetate-CoA ligase
MAGFICPKAVICTGEPLLDVQRLALRNLFTCPIVNEYGTTENGILAFECEHGGMHILADNVLLEFLKDGKPVADGELGEIVVTELFSRSIPFIRYRTGDLGSPYFSRKCLCGRSLPLMKIVVGRQDNFIVRADGEKVYDAVLAYILKKGVKQFRATQETIDRLVIEVVADKDFNVNLEDMYRRKLAKYLGNELQVNFLQVPSIPIGKGGKLEYFISKVKETPKA